MKTLIFGTSYVDTPERAWLVDRWVEVNKKLNPECDILIVDSASPLYDLLLPAPGVHLYQFGDNLGHLQTTGRDGWGRAFCTGIEIAISTYNQYDYVAYIDTDFLFVRPVREVIGWLVDGNIMFGSCDGPPYQWIEGGLVFANVPWLRDVDFVGKYNWPNMCRGRFPEFRLAEIAGSQLVRLPLRGRRNDDNVITPANVAGLDWLTHCADINVYKAFLRANGFEA